MNGALKAILIGLVAIYATNCHGNLVHHYPFTTDASDVIGGADGVLLNGATVSGGVLTLDGSDDYTQIGQMIVPTSGSYSVAMFALRSVPVMAFTHGVIISQGMSGGPGFYMGIDFGTPNFRVHDSWGNTGAPYPTDGGWHHFALTVDASAGNSKLYIDGALSATLGFPLVTAAAGTDTRFGRQLEAHTEFFAGMLDDIRIYDHALSAADVAGLTAVPEATPILLFGAVSVVSLGVRKWMGVRRGIQ
jgi:hypothetical protein